MYLDTTESITPASYLDLLFYYFKLGGMVNFTLLFTTNEIISISTSQTVRSYVVIVHLRRCLTFLSLSLYDTAWLAPRMNDLF